MSLAYTYQMPTTHIYAMYMCVNKIYKSIDVYVNIYKVNGVSLCFNASCSISSWLILPDTYQMPTTYIDIHIFVRTYIDLFKHAYTSLFV